MKKYSKNIRWGLLGLGKIARKMAHDLQLVPEAKLQAVASRALDKAESFAAEFGAVSAYGTYEELCSDSEVDLVYIATPHSFHYEHARMAIEAGKSVLVEKPISLKPEECSYLIALAKAHKVFLMEGIWTRFIPATEKYLELLEAGRLGEIRSIKADFGFAAPYQPQGRLFNPNLGGGSLYDVGIYPLYLALLSLGKAQITTVDAEFGASGVEVDCHIELTFDKGAKAKLHSSLIQETPTEAFISGSAADLKLHRRFHHSENISLYLKNGDLETFHLPYQGLGYVHEIIEVNRCMNLGSLESPKLSWNMTLTLNELLHEVQNQIELKKS